MAGTNAHSATNYETLVLNAANDGSAQRLMPKTYLRFNELAYWPAVNSGSLGLVGNGNLVTATNNASGPTSTGFEPDNSALALDGTKGWASSNGPEELNISGQITLEAWIRPGQSQGATARIVSHGPPVLSSFLEPDGTSQVESNAAPTVSSEVALSIVENGTRYSVGTYEGTNFHGVTALCHKRILAEHSGCIWLEPTMARNGRCSETGRSLRAHRAQLALRSIEDAEWAVGATGSGWADAYAGLVDEVAIYNKALTPAQISGHYTGSATSPTLGVTRDAQGTPVIYWSSGTLQHSDNVDGPYTNVPNNPPSPYQVPSGPDRKFYRLVL
jgi:hypothetical protein